MEGPEELDDCVQTLQKEDLLDSDLTEYVASLVSAEVSRSMGIACAAAVVARRGLYAIESNYCLVPYTR